MPPPDSSKAEGAGRLTPQQRYQLDLQRTDFLADQAQAHAVGKLQQLHGELMARKPRRNAAGLGSRLIWPAVRGLYLWGGVGRGKTYLMDCFYDSLPFSRKRRTHFHRFMQEVHETRKRHPDTEDPLARIAEKLAETTRVLCFDEFFVSDIADAMILARLLEVLFANGVTLVATSNVQPDNLYRDGLQRERFLPAIALLKRHTAVIEVNGATDYRMRVLEQAEIYHHPLDRQADENLLRYFNAMATEPGADNQPLELFGRAIPTRRLAEGILWLDFSALCSGPRAAADYVEMARDFHTVLVSGIPILDRNLEDETRRFINMVDEFYDRNVNLILSAAVPLENLYQGERLRFEFRRTVSRLQEMQSLQYLARPHLP